MTKKSPRLARARKSAPAKRSTKATTRSARRSSRSRSAASKSAAAKVAERERPGWTAVKIQPTAIDSAGDLAHPDASVPELPQLKQKYFGSDTQSNGVTTPSDDAEIVTMEPKAPGADYRAGRKATIVQKNRVIGEQG